MILINKQAQDSHSWVHGASAGWNAGDISKSNFESKQRTPRVLREKIGSEEDIAADILPAFEAIHDYVAE